MKNKGKNLITTDPLTAVIEAHAALSITRRYLESELDWQLRRDAEIMRLHHCFQYFLDKFLNNTEDRQLAVEIFQAIIGAEAGAPALAHREQSALQTARN
jgi:hypothetical protein